MLEPVHKEQLLAARSWINRTNTELEEPLAQLNIVGETKAHILQWLSHLEIMAENRNVKRVYLGRSNGRRPVGCFSYHCSDADETDLRELQANNWQEIT